jgi:Concanavalin A-like lectin/glucanases superfamily/Glycosyl hydrolases family 16
VLGLIAIGLCAGSAVVMAQQEAGTSRAAASKSMVAAYSFSDPAVTGMRFADRSGNRGLAVGRNVRRAEGRFGAGLAFNGKSSSLTVSGRPVLDLDDAMTLSAWVKPQTARGTRTIVARLGRRGAAYAVHAATVGGGPGGEARLARGTKRVSVPQGLPLGRWTHVALTYDGSRMRLYENAEEVRSVPMTGSIRDANGPLRIGGRVPGGGWFKGVLDEVRVYDRALSAAQIRGAMRRGAPARPAPSAAPPPAPAPPGPSASGVPAPAGDLPGWRQIFLEDFTQNVASWGSCSTYDQGRVCSSLPEPLRSKWWAYPSSYQDTREKTNGDGGHYEPRNLSISSGMLQWPMRRVNGETEGAAPAPKIGPRAYGRYAVRFRMESAPGFKVAWLFWRASGSWGEIDFPEGELDGGICAFNHGSSGGNAFARCSNTPMAGVWHTAVIEWTPGRITYYLDDQQFGTTTSEVPGMPMNWILQSETSLDGPPPNGTSANIYVDWVAAWAPS